MQKGNLVGNRGGAARPCVAGCARCARESGGAPRGTGCHRGVPLLRRGIGSIVAVIGMRKRGRSSPSEGREVRELGAGAATCRGAGQALIDHARARGLSTRRCCSLLGLDPGPICGLPARCGFSVGRVVVVQLSVSSSWWIASTAASVPSRCRVIRSAARSGSRLRSASSSWWCSRFPSAMRSGSSCSEWAT